MLKGNRIICIINNTHYFLWEDKFAAKSKCSSFGVLENLDIGFGDEKKKCMYISSTIVKASLSHNNHTRNQIEDENQHPKLAFKIST